MEDKELPEFHWYRVAINFSMGTSTKNEVINEIELKAGDWTFPIEVGNLKLIYDDKNQSNFSGKGIKQRMQAMSGFVTTPWGTGEQIIGGLMLLTAEETINLKQLYLYRNGEWVKDDIQECKLILQTDGGTQEVLWEEGNEILIRAGESFKMNLLLNDEAMAEAEYGSQKILVLEYELNGEICYAKLEMDLTRQRLPWEVYACQYHGIDTQDYYKNYYNVCIREDDL